MTTTSAAVKLYQFGTTVIPGYRGAFTWTGDANDTTIATLGGPFDAAGTGNSGPKLPARLSYTGLAVHATDTTQIRTSLDALRARLGAYDQLWLYATDGGQRYAYARLLAVTPAIAYGERGTVQFTLGFQVQTTWRGAAHSGAITLDTLLGPKTFTTTNSGDADCEAVEITVTAGSAAITALTITCGSCELAYTATIAPGKVLVIDTAAKSVIYDGGDAWTYLQRTASHTITPWMRLASGDNTVSVARTGGDVDSTIEFVYNDAWA